MSRLDHYRTLLRECHAAIDTPHWPEHWPGFVVRATELWERLTAGERTQALGYANELYQARLAR